MSAESGMVLVPRDFLDAFLRAAKDGHIANTSMEDSLGVLQDCAEEYLAAAPASPPTPAVDGANGDAIFLRNVAAEVFFPDGMVAKQLLEIAERIEKPRSPK